MLTSDAYIGCLHQMITSDAYIRYLHQMLTSDDYIRSDVLANEKIVRLTEMTELLISYVSHVFGC